MLKPVALRLAWALFCVGLGQALGIATFPLFPETLVALVARLVTVALRGGIALFGLLLLVALVRRAFFRLKGHRLPAVNFSWEAYWRIAGDWKLIFVVLVTVSYLATLVDKAAV